MSQEAENRDTVTHSLAPEKFVRVRALFEAALERPARDRRAYLEGACGADRVLLDQVLGMLAAEAKGGMLDGAGSSSASSASSPEEGRFPAGSTLADRYRILGLLGRGGMGEVYRAFDIRLNQTVALKFLPDAARTNPRLLDRFRTEVRIARQVSHRNVCRVYDLGEFEDMPFLSMEYVDGEDLRSLLRRIGRLPGDKAIEIARKLCAGLSAAHEKGVLHRDLKPANIMIDGQGQVRIMDFGLAAMANGIAGGDIRSGTPAYMAPEQLDGREVTVRSDLYSLGLVLAEMFTGHSQTKTKDGRLSTTVKDLDPLVEQAIERCLDQDASRRPESALALARMLPGGDPLAEALAAGETPSPAMVAASDNVGLLSARGAVLALSVTLASLLGLIFWNNRNGINSLVPLPYSADVMDQKSREMAARLGYSDAAPDTDRDSGFRQDNDVLSKGRNRSRPTEYRAQLRAGQPAAIYFSYLQCPVPIAPFNILGTVFPIDPPRVPGCIDVRLDTVGRLISFQAIPLPASKPATEPLAWESVLREAGLDPNRWALVEPEDSTTTWFDERRAWIGSYPDSPNDQVRIEAAAWRGRLTSFETFGFWREKRDAWRGALVWNSVPTLFLLGLSLTGVVLAFVNVRSGRADLVGSFRLGLFVMTCSFLATFFENHHTASGLEIIELAMNLAFSLLLAMNAGMLYLGLEPFVRRYWPQTLIGWTRLLVGRVRDPLVGGQILAGIGGGFLLSLVVQLQGWLAGPPPGNLLLEVSSGFAQWFRTLSAPFALAVSFMLLLVILRGVLRHKWLVAAASVLTITMATGELTFLALVYAVLISFMALRFGLLAMAVGIAATGINAWPLTLNFNAWYAPLGWLGIVPYLAVALWSFRTALAGRKLLPQG